MGFSIGATDGEIGTVKEFYFDDESLSIRYLIVQTGNWLFERKVLIPTEAIQESDWDHQRFLTNLTKEQIRNSPDIDTDQPVSRQKEKELFEHYPLPNYWGPRAFSPNVWAGAFPFTTARVSVHKSETETKHDIHLRSAKELTGYRVSGVDGDVGELEDFVMDPQTWKLEFFIVDTSNWFPGQKIMLSPHWIQEINWANSTIFLNRSLDGSELKQEYDPSNFNRERGSDNNMLSPQANLFL